MFDDRNMLVDVPQECCGTPAEQAQKRKEFAGVSQNPLKIADRAQAEEIHVRCSKTEEKGCEVK